MTTSFEIVDITGAMAVFAMYMRATTDTISKVFVGEEERNTVSYSVPKRTLHHEVQRADPRKCVTEDFTLGAFARAK